MFEQEPPSKWTTAGIVIFMLVLTGGMIYALAKMVVALFTGG